MISDEGLDLLDEIKGIESQAEEIFGNLSIEEVQMLSNLLDKVRLLS